MVRIEPLSPDYEHGETIKHEGGGHWVPPITPNGLREDGNALLLRWEGGRIAEVPSNNSVHSTNLDRNVYQTATVFTQVPDTPHLLAVPINAKTNNIQQQFGRGWQRILFNHIQVPNSNRYYSYISHRGGELTIAAPTPHHWTPELLDPWYDCKDTQHATRKQAGLIGELSLLFALAAFSVPPTSQRYLVNSMAPGKWIPHGQNTGRRFAEFIKLRRLC